MQADRLNPAHDAPQAQDALLQMRGIHKRFAGVHALRGVSVTLQRGQIYHLLGENGCGKSTLIKIISGAQPPDEGTLELEGITYKALTPIQALAAGVETVYQDLSLLPNMSVAENVALSEQLVKSGGALARVLDRAALHNTARRALAAVDLPVSDAFLHTTVSDLSLAVRQLVAIARAIAVSARLVIMDEPTTSLTRREVDQLIGVVEKLRREQVTVLFVTHKLDECFAIGGQVIVIRDGQCVAQGAIADFTKKELGRLMTGKTLDQDRYRSASPTAVAGHAPQPLLQVQSLGCGAHFSEVSFTLDEGEILGLTGLMDSGRNELALSLAGVLPADRGSVLIAGQVVALTTPAQAIAQRIGYVPEDRLAEGLFLDKPIRDNIIAAVLGRLVNAFGLVDRVRAATTAAGVVSELRINTPGIEVPVQSLSGGNQQRVLIGRWLTIAPRLLVLHGPTVGVDVGSKDTIYRAIQRLAAKGLGVLIISDDLPELLQNCDRILVMRRGRVCEELAGVDATEAQLYQAMAAADALPAAQGRL